VQATAAPAGAPAWTAPIVVVGEMSAERRAS